MERYVALLLREVRAMEVDAAAPAPLRTVFFGGGTPSLLPPDLLEAILAGLDRAFGLDPAAEVSLEADPGTFSRQGLGALRAAGVNRLSVGVQSFDAAELEACGRAHSLRDALEAIDAVHAVGFPSWSLDLMSGLPRQTVEGWGRSLEQALDAGPDHLSVYDLQVEPGTPFARWYEPGARPLPLEAEAAEMYRLASRTLRGAGFEHYEVSSYARPGHRCRHNQVYWSGEPFWGFGLGAASFVGGRRVTRPRKMKGYEAWVPQLEARPMAAEPGPRTEAEARAAAQDGLLDFVMLQLRLVEGLGLEDVAERAGGGSRGARMAAGVLEAVRPHAKAGTARVCGEGSARRVQLVDPDGLLVSNDIISDVFAALD
jgi:oxygen-independent coproporphyrinogen-3 oxidase